MKKNLILLVALFTGAVAFAQPSIAVLDALLDEGIDSSARIPVTEKIIEALVASGRYTVLDRSNVKQVLEEKKFQLSGLVENSEIKQAGVYLGAAFVCVAKVSKVGKTYFVSGKIINVETGAIEAQNSQESRGEIDIVLDLARGIGTALSGGAVEPLPEQEASTEETKPSPQTGSQPKATPIAHIILSYQLPLFIGSGNGIINDQISSQIASTGGTGNEYKTKRVGFSLHLLQPLFSIFYASASVSYAVRSDQSDYFSFATDTTQFVTNFSLIDLDAAAGVIFRLFPAVQLYGGVGAGALVMSLLDGMWTSPLTEAAAEVAVETGADLLLFDLITINASLVFRVATLGNRTIYTGDESIGLIALSLGGGITY